MRAMTADLFNQLPFLEKGWEYATEMIVSARNLDAKIIEIPIHFYREPKGRISHHKRSSWLSPFRAGWGTLRVTTTYLIDRLFVLPGLIGLTSVTLLNFLIFMFPNFFISRFHVGLISQSYLTFISSITGFMFTSGMLARLAYRRKSEFLKIIFSNRFSNAMFTVLTVFVLLQIFFTSLSVSQWLAGTKSSKNEFLYDFRYISWWLAFSSLFVAVLSISVVSLIGTQVQKFKKS
jgi:hypothetical protein